MDNKLVTLNSEIGSRKLSAEDAKKLWWDGKLSFDNMQEVSMQENGIELSRYKLDDGSIINELELRELWWTNKMSFDKMCEIKKYNKVV